MSKGNIEIPVHQIDSQLDRIAANVRRLIADCRILVKDGSRNHAAAMSVFALEELVKYRCLKEERKSALAAGKTNFDVDERIFGKGYKTHEHKLGLQKSGNSFRMRRGKFTGEAFPKVLAQEALTLMWFSLRQYVRRAFSLIGIIRALLG